ncbi:MAG TPA: hypothetical protein DHV17_00285, partial [Chitinophagaceae bacterium]|nr:hypothetical protein [Chitinophagaceae bacterium]
MNLATHCPYPDTRQTVIHMRHEGSNMARAGITYPVDEELYFSFSEKENGYSMLKRLHGILPGAPGAFVLNYGTEMAMLDHYPVRQTTYQLVHDQYNVRLSEQYGHLVDVFICHNTHIYEDLKRLHPGREQRIFYRPHGVPIPAKWQQHNNPEKPLKLFFLGRMTKAKGIFDLPVISKHLVDMQVPFEWTCIGNGPELEQLKKEWPSEYPVRFLSPATNNEVMDICAEQDLFVLPTKFEGSPVSLIETMSAGLVPVISKLPGGITDIVQEDIGYALPVDDNLAFAKAITELHANRPHLAEMGRRCRAKIIQDFDVRKTAAAYHALFHRYEEFYTPKNLRKLKIGSRLDHPVIPNWLTKL